MGMNGGKIMRQTTNKVFITGILSELKLEESVYDKNGQKIDCVRGSFIVKVPLEREGVPENIEIPVNVFRNKYIVKDGIKKIDGGYEQIINLMQNGKSIATVGDIDKASIVSVSGANINMNEYIKNGRLVSIPRVQASFVKILPAGLDFKPQASFTCEMVICNITEKVDKDGIPVEPKVLKVQGAVPKYNGIDVITFTATDPIVVNGIENYWNENDTVSVSGVLDFRTITTESVGAGFGAPIRRTEKSSDLIILHGSEPLLDEMALPIDEIKMLLSERAQRIEAQKAKETANVAPSKTATMSQFGF